MQVLLKEDVDHLGYAGDVKKVAPGYGRNYLLPRGLAVLATNTAMKQAEAWRTRAAARREELKAEYDALAARIAEVVLEFKARAGQNGRLYGSITTSQVAEALNEQLGTEIDRRKLEAEPLRDLGEHTIRVRLDADHTPEFTVNLMSEDGSYEAMLEAQALGDAAGDAELAEEVGELSEADDTLEADPELGSAMEEALAELSLDEE